MSLMSYPVSYTHLPKGVQITYDNLNNYINWIHNVVGNEKNKVYLNQAPFSFDLSVMDLYLSLYSESTLFAITKKDQQDFSKLYANLEKSNITNWVSTPSFADMCLSLIHIYGTWYFSKYDNYVYKVFS